jgi:hypothetical protein
VSKGRKVPPREMPTETVCDCDSCQRGDRIIQREMSRISTVAMAGYRDHGRGAVAIHLCKDCGEHIADDRPDNGVEYISQHDAHEWPLESRKKIADYWPDKQYVAAIFDHFSDGVRVVYAQYPATTPSA